jgi:hypothetical protein
MDLVLHYYTIPSMKFLNISSLVTLLALVSNPIYTVIILTGVHPMVMATQANPLVDMSSIFANVAPYVLGKPGDNKTETTTSSTDPTTQAFMQAILASIGDGSGFSKQAAITDSMGPVQNLVQQALQRELPGISSAAKGSGLYNSTTEQMLQNDLAARTTAAGSDAVQKNILNYAQIQTAQADAATRAAQVNKTTTAKTASTPPLDISKLLLQLGISAGAKKLYDKSGLGSKIDDLFSSGNSGGGSLTAGIDANASVNQFEAALPGENAITSSVSFDAAPTAVQGFSASIDGSTGTDASGNAITNNAASAGAGATAASNADLASALSNPDALDASLVSNPSGAAAEELGVGAGATIAETGGFAAADAVGGASIIEELAPLAIEGSSVVCYELVRTGEMEKYLADASSAYAPKLPAAVIRGYHYMCPLILRLMRKHSTFRSFMRWAAVARSHELTTSSTAGKLVRVIFEPACWLLGHTVARDTATRLNIPEMLTNA